jgi:hypothetical protein
MQDAHRRPAAHAWLLVVGLLLLGAIVVASVASATTSAHARRASLSCGTRKTVPSRGRKRRAAHRRAAHRRAEPKRSASRRAARKKGSSARLRAKCVPVAVKGSKRIETASPGGPSQLAGACSASACREPSPGEVAEPKGTEPGSGEIAREESAPFRFFAPTSFWNAPVPADAPLDPSSGSVVRALVEKVGAEEETGRGPWIDTTSWTLPVYTVPADQPTVPVQLEGGDPKDSLASAFSAVPLPSDAQPAGGSDKELVVWQPSTERLWEFWRLEHKAGGWQASGGGAMQDVSAQQGVYGPEVWPGAKPWWGANGSSLSNLGGMISLEDLKLGQINHALTIGAGETRAGVYASPAQRTDGTSKDPLSLPEGAHLRLNPSVNLVALHLPRLTLMIAEAAQRYGVIVTDSGPNVGFATQDPTPTGTEPFAGPSGYFEGKTPSELLASFPWGDLELLKMELHTTS